MLGLMPAWSRIKRIRTASRLRAVWSSACTTRPPCTLSALSTQGVCNLMIQAPCPRSNTTLSVGD